MANYYSKKRPKFKPNLDMYKKSFWTKFKEALSHHITNFKRFMAKVTYKINEKGSQRLTIMVVPHNEKKIMNIQISNYILFFSFLVLSVTVAFSIVAIANNQETYVKMSNFRDQNQDKKVLIEEYQKSIESVNKRYAMFKTDINNIIKTSGKDKSIYNTREIKLIDDTQTNVSIPKEVEELEKMESDLEVTKESIRRLGVFVESQKKLLREIPSKYPLAVYGRFASPYGYRLDPVYIGRTAFHAGIDLVVLPGTHVLAAADGIISYAGWNGGYGYMVDIKHKYGFTTRYAHMMYFAPGIEVGASVKQGQTVGYVGSTGKSTG